MKKRNIFIGSIIALGLLTMTLPSCDSAPKTDEEGFPVNPTDGQSYRHNNGTNSVWNAAMGYWMISSMVRGQAVNHRFYPSSGKYTDGSGTLSSRESSGVPRKSTSRSGFGSSRARSGS